MASTLMASVSLSTAVAATVKATQPSKASLARAPCAQAATFKQRTVSNGAKATAMLVWQPTNNKYFETFSYLPPLNNDDIAKQVDYIVANGWIPCLEFSEPDIAYIAQYNAIRMGAVASGYYDNRYWTMYKLPMFGCSDPGQVLTEIQNCAKSFPNAYIRLIAFDNVRQVQILSFLVHRPPNAEDHRPVDQRQV